MRISKLVYSPVLLASCVLVACAQQPASEPNVQMAAETSAPTSKSTVRLGPAISTVKPGASISFAHDEIASDAGENASVTITVNEGYPVGTLNLRAIGDDGLDVFGSGVTARMDMADKTTHTWRVDYRAEQDGVYYLGVVASAELENDYSESRAYAVRIEVGDWQSEQAKVQAAKPMAAQADGEMAVIMEAEETIE